jgi:hypothetical protein
MKKILCPSTRFPRTPQFVVGTRYFSKFPIVQELSL